MSDLPEVVEQLASRVDALEKRVHALEHLSEEVEPSALPMAQAMQEQVERETHAETAHHLFTVLGRALLGVAGAYVLRAVAESNLLPRSLVAAVAILYAFAWLAWAAQSKAAAPVARAIYAGASALILMPMLWELSLRFSVLSPAMSAAVLCAFVILATALAWKHDLAGVYWMAFASAGPIALALAATTHVMMPFLAALLMMVLLSEYAVTRSHGRGVRTLASLVADVAIAIFVFIYSRPENARIDYPALSTMALVAPASLFFFIHAVGVSFRTAHMKRPITIFSTGQIVVAFALAATSIFYFVPHNGAATLGIACLALAVPCYWLTFAVFRREELHRNFRVFATWSSVLLLMGALLALPEQAAMVLLGLAALAAIVVAVRQECITLDFHGAIFLTAAAIVSGTLDYSFKTLAAATLPQSLGWSLLAVSAFAVTCYAVGKERVGEDWQHQLMHLIPALLAVFAVCALVVQGLMRLVAVFAVPAAFHLAFVRSLTLCSAALVLALGGALWQRLEMTRIAYAALAFEAAKLLFEDIRNGRVEFTAASIFVFAVTLIGVPRLTRMRHRH